MLIAVPPALHARSATFEASGIAWAPSLQRYLIVSDDTGPPGNDHQPWLLAMSKEGVFDDQVVPIEGIDELNDGESICKGPDGLFFLLSSHSPNKKGLVPPARRRLLLMELKGRAMKVVGQADLSAYVDAKGRSLLDVAGVAASPATGHLDLEAATYQDRALYIGMKSPLTATGAAVILRIESPVEALRAGRIPPGALTRSFDVTLRTKHVSQGIADLTRLPDGTWFLVANEPKGLAADGGGSLYMVAPKSHTAILLKQFEGLRPEGVTVAEDGKSLIIVFDMNENPPLWLRWPLKP